MLFLSSCDIHKLSLKMVFCLFLIFTAFNLVRGISVSLSGHDWNIVNSNGSIKARGTVPGGIYTDLRNAGVLKEDILYRFNDIDYRWVGRDQYWVYSLDFKVPQKLLETSTQQIIFHGIDGIAAIYLNGINIGSAENTFVQYAFDVTHKLKESNQLKVQIMSPILSGNALAAASPHSIPPPCVPSSYQGECHVNFLRRMQASFAWDWGPAFPSVGIWKDVEVLGIDVAVIKDVTVRTTLKSGCWHVITNVHFEGKAIGVVSTMLETKKGVANGSNDISRSVDSVSIYFTVSADDVDLWWPNGYGEQNLYKLGILYRDELNHVSSKFLRIGFRTVKLIQKRVDVRNIDKGLTFYFEVNGVPVFAKGSNYIPSHAVLEKTSDEEQLKDLLQATKLANMNMLRVWGGGIYETDYFYKLCDEYGIMIWQDMMFACNMYPVDEKFLASVKSEITQQVTRLQYHPSIVIWAGNNENEAALSGNWYGTNSNYPLYHDEYVQLYVYTIRTLINKLDNTRPYIVSSPTNGLKSDIEGYVAKNPYSPLYGDLHRYNYVANSWLIDEYPMTRFCSEYGYQSMPSWTTLANASTKDDLMTINSEFFKQRQHLPAGYIYLLDQIYYHLPVPPVNDVHTIIYFSQIVQAMAIKSQTEWYRKWKSILNTDGTGLTSGALYWQLNDIWASPTWASIEYGGKWKMLHYFAKNFFAPVLAFADLSQNGNISLNFVSDLLYDIPQTTLIVNFYRWDRMNPVSSATFEQDLKKESSNIIFQTTVEKFIGAVPECQNDAPFESNQNCFLKLTLLSKNHSVISPINYLFPSTLKTISLQPANVTLIVEKSSSNLEHVIRLKTNAIALFVWLDAGEIAGYFSDNGFTMTEETETIIFYAKSIVSSDLLQKSIEITVLNDKLSEVNKKPKIDNSTYHKWF